MTEMTDEGGEVAGKKGTGKTEGDRARQMVKARSKGGGGPERERHAK